VRALGWLLSDRAPTRPWKDNAGIYLVAFGEPARRCATTCISACKQAMPDVPVALCSTKPLNAGEDVFIEQADKDIGGRIAKLAAYENALAEWEYVLYLDADTEPIEDLSWLRAGK